jgi:hypothetical protein
MEFIVSEVPVDTEPDNLVAQLNSFQEWVDPFCGTEVLPSPVFSVTALRGTKSYD